MWVGRGGYTRAVKHNDKRWMMRRATIALLLSGAGVTGCAARGGGDAAAVSVTDKSAIHVVGSKDQTPRQAQPEAEDLEAVLAMAGTFAVSYRHAETAALAPGRVLAKPYVADALECVRVVERSPYRVSLQYLLLIGDGPLVVKHWREDWQYAAGRRLVYRGPAPDGGLWSVKTVSPVEGQWTRTVYGADDAPGYAAVGRWTHRGAVGDAGAVSEWDAQEPGAAPASRHASDRSGHDAVRVAWARVQDRVVVHHGGANGGWTREESVVKLDASGTPLAREHGVIRYERRGGGDPPAVGAYWERVGGFWALVRAGWAQRLPAGATLRVRDRLSAGPRWRALFALADADVLDTRREERAAQLNAVLDAAVVHPEGAEPLGVWPGRDSEGSAGPAR